MLVSNGDRIDKESLPVFINLIDHLAVISFRGLLMGILYTIGSRISASLLIFIKTVSPMYSWAHGNPSSLG